MVPDNRIYTVFIPCLNAFYATFRRLKLMLFKTLAALGIALPLIGFGLLVIQPSLNINVAIPLLRYYFVTFAALVGCVISFFVVAALRETRRIRPLLLALMFGWMSLLYVIHGALTVGALIGAPHPAALWSPWIALWGGGALLLAGAWLPNQRDGRLVALLASVGGLALLGFLGLAAVAPQVLDALSGDTGRMAQVSGVLVLWGLALFSHLWHWARKPDGLDGVFVIDSLWGLMAVGALHLFADGQLGWWLHIAVLLLAWLTTMTLLWRTEERVRAFHLTRTYAVASAIVTAALALASGEVYSRIVFGNLVDEVVTGSGAINRGLAANLATHLDLESADQLAGLQADADLESWMAGQLANFDVLASGAIYSLQGLRVYPAETQAPSLPAIVSIGDVGFLQASRGETADRLLAPGSGATFDPTDDHYYALLYTPVASPEGSPAGVLITLRDIPGLTEAEMSARAQGLGLATIGLGALFLALLGIVRRADRLIAERTGELERAYADLVAVESQRNDLTHMIVHDLRNPLTAIAANLELMVRGIRQEVRGGNTSDHTAVALQAAATTQLVGRALGASQRMMGMIDDLVHINKFEAGEFQLDLEPLPLAELMQEHSDRILPLAEREAKTVSVAIAPDLPMTLADSQLIGRVLENLLSNAVKFTPHGGSIGLSAERRGDAILVWVRDNGDGVPPEDRARIFEKHFQRRDDNGRPIRAGAGLGLTFCRLAVEAHGGRIGVECPPEGGSIFYFTVPVTAQIAAPRVEQVPTTRVRIPQ